MFFVDQMKGHDIWFLGDFAGSKRNKTAAARADLTTAVIKETGLTIVPDAKGHPRHANVGRWPSSKDEQKAVALELCARSTLFVRGQ